MKKLPEYIKNLNSTGATIKALNKIDIGVVGVNYGNIDAYQKAIKGLSAEQAVAVLSSKKLNAAQIEEIMTTESATLAKGTYTQADVQAALAKQGLTTATSVLTAEQQSEIINSGLLTSDKLAEVAATLGLETAESGALVSKKALNLETVKQQLTSIGVIGTQQEQILTLLGLVGAEGAATGATNILTGAFNALKASMAAHPIGWIIAGVAALVAGLIALKSWIDKNKEAEAEAIKQAHEDAKTALDNSKSDLQNVQSELSSVKSELSGINDEIKSIASKGKLDFVDQKQITKLAQQKRLLEQNQRILENNEKMTARQSASEAKKLLDTKVENKYYLPRGGSTVGTYNYEQTVENQIDSLNQIYDLYNDYLIKNMEGTNKYLPQIRQQITNQKDAITGTINDLYNIVNSFKYSDGTIIEGYEDIYKQYMGYINNLQSLTDPDMFYQIIQDTDNEVTGVDLEKIYQQLLQDVYAGKFDINKVDENFIKALESKGITKDTIEQIFKNRQQEYQRILNNIDYAFDYENVQPQRGITGGYYPSGEGYQDLVKKGYLTAEQAAQKEATEEKAKLKIIHDTLEKYAQDNPIDYQVIATYDDEQFNKLKGYVDKEFEKTGDYATATTNAIQDLKNEMTSADKVANQEFLLDTDTIVAQIDGLKDSIDDIASAYSDMMSIIDDFNENGNLSVDNLETLIDLGDDYIGTLFNENGELELNKNSYVALAKAKLEDIRYSMLEKAISEINALSKDDETTATDSLADSTGNLTEQTLKLAAARKIAEGVDSSRVQSILDTYSQWNALIDNVITGLEDNTDATLGVSDATDEATDSSDAYEDALNAEKDALEDTKDALEDQKDALEDVKDGYEDAVDNIKELIDWVQDYIKQVKNNEIDALEAKKDAIDDLIEAQKDLLNAEKDEYDWQKTITDKQNTVAKNALAASIASLDDSSAGKKAQKQTAETLANSRKDIIDELYDHSIDERLDYLDTLKDEQDAYYDEQIDKINDYLNDEVQLYKDACEIIDKDSGDLYGKLLWYCQNYTTTSEAEFNHMWSSAQSAMQQYNTTNLGTFDLLNNLQGRIYEVDTAIDEVSRSISEYESAIDGVQSKIDSLGEAAEETINKINNIKATSISGNWYVDYNGKRYSSFFDNKNDAINDLKKQVTQSVPFNELNPLLINNGTVKHYATGTRSAKGGVSGIDENGKLETLMKQTPNGNYVIMDKGDQVYTKEQTDNLHDFSNNPSEYIKSNLIPLTPEELSDFSAWGDMSQIGYSRNLIGNEMINNLVEKVVGGTTVPENSTTNNTIAPVVNINIQGDATQSTINALRAETSKIQDHIINKMMKIPIRNKFVI